MSDLFQAYVRGQQKQFIERMKKEKPEHAKLYCQTHGEYVGFNEFRSCTQCMEEKLDRVSPSG